MVLARVLPLLSLILLVSCVGTIQGTQDTQNVSKEIKDPPKFQGITDAHPVSHDSIQVVFERPKDRSRSYNFSVYVDGNFQTPLASIDEQQCNFENLVSCRVLVRGLQLGKSYRVAVRAQDKKTLVEDENQKTVVVSTLTYKVPIFPATWEVASVPGISGKTALEVRVTNAEPAEKDFIFGGPARADLGVKCYQAFADLTEKGVLSKALRPDSASNAVVCEPNNAAATGANVNRTIFSVGSLVSKSTYYLIIRACDQANRCEQNSVIRLARTRSGEPLSFNGLAAVNLDNGDPQNWGFGTNGAAGRTSAVLRFFPEEAKGDVTGFVVAAVPKGSTMTILKDAAKSDGFRVSCSPQSCVSGVYSLTKTSSVNCVSKKNGDLSEMGCRLQGLTPYTEYSGVIAAIDDCLSDCATAGATKSLPFVTAPEVILPRLGAVTNGAVLSTARFQLTGFADLGKTGVGAVHVLYREKVNNSFGPWNFFLESDAPKAFTPNAQGIFEQQGLKTNSTYGFQVIAADEYSGVAGSYESLKKPLSIEGLESFIARWQKFNPSELTSTQKILSTAIDWPLPVLDGSCLEVKTSSFAFNLPTLDQQRPSYREVEYQFRVQGQTPWSPTSNIFSTALLSVSDLKKITLTNLEPGTRYEFRFRFLLGEERSPWSHPDNSQWAVCQTTGIDLAFQDFVQIISIGPAITRTGVRIAENAGFSSSKSRQELAWWTDPSDALSSIEVFNRSIGATLEVSANETNLNVNGRDVIVYDATDVNDRALATVSTRGIVKLIFPDATLGTTGFSASKVNFYDVYRARLSGPTDSLTSSSLTWLKVGGELVADNSGFVTFVDYTAGVTNPLESVAYAYRVVPVRPGGTVAFDPTTASQATIRIILPQANMTYVHRRMANKIVCSRITGGSIVETKTGACLLPSGVRIHGATSRQYLDVKEPDPAKQVKTGLIFDLGKHLIFDRYELGCVTTQGQILGLKINTSVSLNNTFSRFRREYEFPPYIQPPVSPFPAFTSSGTSPNLAPVHNYVISPSLRLTAPGVSDVANSLQYFKSLAEKNKPGLTTYGFIDTNQAGLVKYLTTQDIEQDRASETEVAYFNFPEPGLRFNTYSDTGIAHFHKVAGTNNIPQLARCLLRKPGDFFYRPVSGETDAHRYLDAFPDTFPSTELSKSRLASACAEKRVVFRSGTGSDLMIPKKLPTRSQQLAFLVKPNLMNPGNYSSSPTSSETGCRVNASADTKWTGKTGLGNSGRQASPDLENQLLSAFGSDDFLGLLKVRGVDAPKCKNIFGASHVWGNVAEWSRENFVCRPAINTRDITCQLSSGEDPLTPVVSADGRGLFDTVDLGQVQHYNNSTPNHLDGFNPIFGLMNTKCLKALDCGSGATTSSSPRLVPDAVYRFGQSLGFAVTDLINSKARGCYHLGTYGEVMGAVEWGAIGSLANSVCSSRTSSYPLSTYARIYGHHQYKDTDSLPVSFASGGDVISNYKFSTVPLGANPITTNGKHANFSPYHFSLERSDVPNADVGARCVAELVTND